MCCPQAALRQVPGAAASESCCPAAHRSPAGMHSSSSTMLEPSFVRAAQGSQPEATNVHRCCCTRWPVATDACCHHGVNGSARKHIVHTMRPACYASCLHITSSCCCRGCCYFLQTRLNATGPDAAVRTLWFVLRLSTCFLKTASQNSLHRNLMISKVSPSRGLSLLYLQQHSKETTVSPPGDASSWPT